MTYDEAAKVWEEYRRIAANLPKVEFIMARQPEPAYRGPPPEVPKFIIVDDLYLLK